MCTDFDVKTCKYCDVEKPRTEFYKNSLTSGGYSNKCKECVRSYQNSPKEKLAKRARDKRYFQTEKGRSRNKLAVQRYRKTTKGKAYIEKDRKRSKALGRDRVYYLVNKLLKKQPCCVCGTEERVHAHHHDYSKPLDVRWLCPKHHHEVHHAIPA